MNSQPMQRLFGGRRVNVFDLQPADIEVVTIAHSLSMVNRFNGHTRFPYSVAQHSVFVACRIFSLTNDANLTRTALLHDASEAFIGDIVRPLKVLRQFEFYLDVEAQIQRRILQSVGLDPIESFAQDLINEVDNQALVTEGVCLFDPPAVFNGHGLPKIDDFDRWFDPRPWNWQFAKRVFVYCFDHPDVTSDYLRAAEGRNTE